MAVSTGYDYGVRKGLSDRGVSSQDIGYNPTSGYVTVKNQNFMKPQKNYQGTTFTNQQDFNNAWKDYEKSQQPQQMTGQPVLRPGDQLVPSSPNAGYNPYQSSNPIDSQYNDLFKALLSQAQNPTPVDANAIYGSPQWAAHQAQAQRGADQGIRAAQESMGAAGFGRSTALGERSQGIQNQANEYLNTQVLPNLVAQAQAEKQQHLQNQLTMLDQLSNQQGVYDTRFNNANNLAIQEGQLTGNYMNPEAESALSNLLSYKAQTEENWRSMSPEQRAAASTQGDALRNIARMAGVQNVDELFGSGVNAANASSNYAKAGQRTLGAQGQDYNQMADARDFEYTQGRDKVADERWQTEFDRVLKQDGVQEALAWAQNSISQQNANTSAFSASTSRESLNWAKDPLNPDNVYKQKQIDNFGLEDAPEEDPPTRNQVYSSYITNIGKIPPEQLAAFFAAEEANIISDIGPDGYDDLFSRFLDARGKPKKK